MKTSIVNNNGIPAVCINGKVIPFYAYRSWRPKDENIAAFGKMGYPFATILPSGIKNAYGIPYSEYGEYWLGDGIYDFDVLRRQIDQYVVNAPDAYVAVNVMLDTRDWFLKAHPDCPDSFVYLSAACSYEPWIKAAERMLSDLVDFFLREYPEKVFCIFLAAGGTCEWHNKKLDLPLCKSRDAHYAAWIEDSEAKTPSEAEISFCSNGNLRDPTKDKKSIRFLQYTNDVITKVLSRFAGLVKERAGESLLVGAAAGYNLIGEEPMSGHSGVADVMKIDDIDIIVCPASYFHRRMDGVSCSQASPDSVRLNRKLFVHSIDNMTNAALTHPYGQLFASTTVRHESTWETENYIKREIAFTSSKGGGFWLFDMFGISYPDNESRKIAAEISVAYSKLYGIGASYNSEIAFVVDPASYIYTDAGSTIKMEQIQEQINELGRIGAPVDYYSTLDLVNPEFNYSQYKLYIFPNCLAPSDDVRSAISALRLHGASMIFIGTAGAVTSEGISVSASSELVGIKLKEGEGIDRAVTVDERFTDTGYPVIYGKGRFIRGITPFFSPDDSEACILGCDFLDERTPRLVMKERNGGFDVWSMRGPLPVSVLRPLCKKAGVFIYQNDGLPTYANSSMVAFYDYRGGVHEITLPSPATIREIYTGESYRFNKAPIPISFAPEELKHFIIEPFKK